HRGATRRGPATLRATGLANLSSCRPSYTQVLPARALTPPRAWVRLPPRFSTALVAALREPPGIFAGHALQGTAAVDRSRSRGAPGRQSRLRLRRRVRRSR